MIEIGSKRDETLIGHARFAGKNPKFDGIPHEGHYTQEEIKEIIEYAEDRYVEIIPEIDMPGHTASLIASYPELGTSKEKINVKKIWGVQDDILIPTENTFNFLENIISELVTLFPSKYIHIGGDEARKKQWIESKKFRIMRDLEIHDEDSLQTYFISRVQEIISKFDRKIMAGTRLLKEV